MEIEKYTDQQIVAAILKRDTEVTKEFLYKRCYPLFKSIFDKYYTDCENCYELINEIYVYINSPLFFLGSMHSRRPRKTAVPDNS
jgi:GTP:adenosylcobinamide-phosphate guanylyltransferase